MTKDSWIFITDLVEVCTSIFPNVSNGLIHLVALASREKLVIETEHKVNTISKHYLV